MNKSDLPVSPSEDQAVLDLVRDESRPARQPSPTFVQNTARMARNIPQEKEGFWGRFLTRVASDEGSNASMHMGKFAAAAAVFAIVGLSFLAVNSAAPDHADSLANTEQAIESWESITVTASLDTEILTDAAAGESLAEDWADMTEMSHLLAQTDVAQFSDEELMAVVFF